MKYFWIIAMLFLGLTACQEEGQNNGSSQKAVEEIQTNGMSNADIIRNPVSADKPLDTVNVAKLEFTEDIHDFGKVKEGETVKHTFQFTNIGKAPLVISNATATCGCTIPKWSKTPIPPGETGEILVNFNTEGKKNFQDKPVTITANTHPAQTVIRLRGTVSPSESQ